MNLTWAVRPTGFGLLTFALSSVVLYFLLPFILAPVWKEWIAWFPILVVAGASVVAGYVTGRLGERSRHLLGFVVGFFGVAAVLAALTAQGSIGALVLIAGLGGAVAAAGSALAPRSTPRRK